MQTDIPVELFILVLLIMLSAFFSSAETALTTVNKIRIRSLAEEGNKRAKKLLKITADSPKMLSAILIGNNLANITASSLTTSVTMHLFGSVGVGIATGIVTLIILVFAEISPKTIAAFHAEKVSLRYANVIYVVIKILTPVIFVINLISLTFLKLLHIKSSSTYSKLTIKDLRTIVNVGHENGVIETEEHDIISNVFDFTDSLVKEVMVPRIDITFINVASSYEDIIQIFRETQYTRLPVYETTTDNVVGILNIKDLILAEHKKDFFIRSLMREPFYTFEYKNTAELLAEMRSKSINIAIVLDEYGSTAGLITLEDLIEEIVGEIRDEYDNNEEEDILQISDSEYFVSGSMNLETLCESLPLSFSSGDYDTIGGYITGLFDHVPIVGEVITTEDHITLRVQKMDKNRVEKIKITFPKYDESLDPKQTEDV